MARTNIDTTNVKTVPGNGYNLSDSADFATLATGDNNGVDFSYNSQDLVLLKAPGGGAADFTIVTVQKDPHSGRNITVPNDVVTVAAGKTWVYSLSESLHKDATTGNCSIDCDVAGQVLVLRRNPK